MRALKRFIAMSLLAVSMVALFTVLRLGMPVLAADNDRGFLADLISKALSTSSSQVSVGAVEGALSSDATVRDIVISDRDGVWLRIDRVRLIWTRSALFNRRLEVDRLEIGKLEIMRRPLPSDAPTSNEPLLPELPVKLIVKVFELKELVLGAPVAGVPARLSSSGSASLGSPAQGLNLELDAKRLDAPGNFAVRLAFVPTTNTLETSLDVDEPAGGILAHLANIPGQPPVNLKLSGMGTLDAFAAKLTFAAGPSIGADGTARLDRVGKERKLNLDLASRIEGLLPPSVGPVFSGTTALTGALRFVDDGGIAIDTLSLQSALAKLDIAGRYGADQTLDFRLKAAAIPNAGGRTKANDSEIGRLDFTGTVKGPASSPAVDAVLAIADARLPYGHFNALNARFTAKPSGVLSDDKTTLALDADGHIRGLTLADPGLGRAIGDRVDFALNGTTSKDGVTRFETLKLASPGGQLSYAGLLGASLIDGTLALKADDLSRLSMLAGRPLAGAADVNARLTGEPNRSAVTATLDGSATDLATSLPAFDRLTGRRLKLSGRLRTLPDSNVEVDHVALAGAFVTANANGRIGFSATDLSATITLPDLAKADTRLSGRGAVTARLTGSGNRLDATADITVNDAMALKRPIPMLAVNARIDDLLGLIKADAKLAGMVDGKPASGALALAKRADGGWSLPALDLSVGSVRLDGNLDIAPSNLAAGQITIAASNLDDLSPLALTKLSGEANATLVLAAPVGQQSIKLHADGARIAVAEAAIERFLIRLDIANAYEAPVINADLSVDKAVIGGQTISAMRFASSGTAVASDFRLSAKAAGFDLAGNGRVEPGDPIRVGIAAFEAKRDGRRIALASPASFTFDKAGIAIRSLALGIEGGRLNVAGRAGSELDLTLDATAVQLSAARIFAPALDIGGTLDAHARIGGTPGAPTGPWQLRIAGLSLPQMRNSGLPPLSISGSGTLAGDRTSIIASLALPRGGTIGITGTAPLDANAALALEAKGEIDAALANTVLASGGRSITGRISLDAKATGTPAAPQLSGTLDLTNGTATDALQGVQLNAVQARLVARGTSITIERASAATRNGGTLSASGRIAVDPAAGFPASIKLVGRRAELVSSPFVTAVTDLDLDIGGPLTQHPRLGGRIVLSSLEVNIAERLPTALKPVDNIRHVNAPREARARLARNAKTSRTARGRRTPLPFDATLALTIAAPNRVFVRGRGLDAELGGELTVNGSLAAPSVNGGFDLRRGRFTVIGQRLDFTRGRVTFNGDATPELDFVAQTQATDVTAIVTVGGSAVEPSFVFSSQPDLPQDEVLSRILFAKASGSLSPFQALQLAQAAAQFSGTGDDTFERLRKSLGVDNLDVQFGASGPTVGVSRYIGNNLSVGVKTGVKPEDSGISVGIDVTKRLKLQLEGTAGGGASAGVGAEIEY